MRKISNAIVCAATACALFVGLVGCGGEGGTPELVSAGDDGFDAHTELQSEYLSANGYSTLPSGVNGTQELSRPRPLKLQWKYDGECKDYTVEISENEDFSDCVSYTTGKCSIEVYNLKVDTAYMWRVTANGKSSHTSEPSVFITRSNAPRNLYVDGVTNVRDLGGWSTGDGTVKQGMIFRCGRLNKSRQEQVQIEITPRGIDVMKNELGVKCEIDLRRPDNNNETGGITSSPLGESVSYFNIPMEFDMSDPLFGNGSAIAEMFGVLGDAKNYPMIFHCDIGTDRTGMMAFLINGLLGVAEEDLYRDYMFSNFGKIGGSRDVNTIKSKYVDRIKSYNGDTLAQKINNYLVEKLGVKQSDIDALRAIMSDVAD